MMPDHFNQLNQYAFFTIMIGACGTALWLGRTSERWTAIVLILASIASLVAQSSKFFQPESGILLIDLALLGYLVLLAMRSDRFWPLYAAGFQIIGTLIHVARITDDSIFQSAYATGQIFWSYPVLLTLAAGTWLEARRRDW